MLFALAATRVPFRDDALKSRVYPLYRRFRRQ
jgi:hypothetical protein